MVYIISLFYIMVTNLRDDLLLFHNTHKVSKSFLNIFGVIISAL